ncbi:hypothetical protein RhiirA4_487026 [Rhizophagus irregularis]|uniref:Uncharacterized protein n=1 Tax=Rhizophagus irregularis TaxID=588596 RepID=A0A2I1HS49_9GLOM|nr:hypothetical protein RhiirA4_487026 [Rhizophagus irregularis]
MKNWMIKSQELKETKLYSWYNDEDVGKEEMNFDNEIDINLWCAFITVILTFYIDEFPLTPIFKCFNP